MRSHNAVSNTVRLLKHDKMRAVFYRIRTV